MFTKLKQMRHNSYLRGDLILMRKMQTEVKKKKEFKYSVSVKKKELRMMRSTHQENETR